MDIIRDIPQNSPEWFQLRLASVGSTSINRIAPQKDGYTTELYKFAGEYLSNTKAESSKFKFADRGHIFEPVARQEYEMIKDVEVELITMVKGDKPHTHTSTDGLISTDRILEIKIRTPAEFLKLAEGKTPPIADRRQWRWDLYICYDRTRVEYVNYCPELHQAGKEYILIDQITRDEEKIKELSEVADVFIKEALHLAGKYK